MSVAIRTRLGQAYRLVRYPNRMQRIRQRIIMRRRQANARLLDQELRSFAVTLKSRPILLYLDPTTVCNLACPFCPTGNGDSELSKAVLEPETFERIVANLHLDLLQHVNFYNWGEPLLNKHLPQYIRFFTNRQISTAISSNFSHKDYDGPYMETLIESGLSEILVSADGASQETYGRYRIKGDFDRVIRNMKTIAAAKKRLGSATPRVQYKMLLNKFNESEIETAKQYAAECDADFLLHEHFWVPPELRDEWVADSFKKKYGDLPVSSWDMRRGETIHTECRQLWDSVLVSANGDMLPCCLIFKESQRVGNLAEQHIDEIWNSAKMQTLRHYVVDPAAAPPDFDNHCEQCTNRYCSHDVQEQMPESAATPSI